MRKPTPSRKISEFRVYSSHTRHKSPTPSRSYRPKVILCGAPTLPGWQCNGTVERAGFDSGPAVKSRGGMLMLAVILLSLPSSVSASRRAGGEGAGRHEHAARPGGSLIGWSQLLPGVPRLWTPDMQPHPPATTNQTCRRGALKMCRDGSRATGVQYGQPCPKELHEMCLVPQEYISDTIVRTGHFPDCEWLVKAWRSHDDPGTRGAPEPDTFVDAGANIGACSLEMLLRTDARVVAFEPSPVNRFHLTTSLQMAARRDPSISRRIVVVPFALGAHNQQSRLRLSGGGSMVVPSIARNDTTSDTKGTAAIEMLSLDGTLAPGLRIRLLKLDVSGTLPRVHVHTMRASRLRRMPPWPGARLRVRGPQGRGSPPAQSPRAGAHGGNRPQALGRTRVRPTGVAGAHPAGCLVQRDKQAHHVREHILCASVWCSLLQENTGDLSHGNEWTLPRATLTI